MSINEVALEPICLLTGKPIKPVLFYESMTEIRDSNSRARIRVWRKSKELPEYTEGDILALFECIPGGAGIQQIIDALSSIEGVAAIEVTDANGCGLVAYLDW